MNALFIMIDTLRADYLGCYGNSWVRTPNIDALAKESVVFDNAYPESTPTLPVRRSVFSMTRCFPFVDWHTPKGSAPVVPGWQGLREEDTSFPEIMTAAGYRAAMISDTYHMMKPGMNFHRFFSVFRWIRGQEADRYGYGELPSDHEVERYLEHDGTPRRKEVIKNYFRNTGPRRVEEDYFAPKVFAEAIRFLEAEYRRGRFLLYVDSFDPHEPWDPPKWYVDMYDPDYQGPELIWHNTDNFSKYSEREQKHVRALYAGEVTMVDTWVGKLIGKLRDMRALDDTLVILIADHGTEHGEHARLGKCPRPYQHNVRLPAMIRFPDGTGAGKRVKSLAMNYDFTHTMLSYLGLEAPKNADSVDLMPVIKGEKRAARKHIVTGWAEQVGIIELPWSLHCTDKCEALALFNLEEDPQEQNDALAKAPEKAKKLMEHLTTLYKERGVEGYSLEKLREKMAEPSSPKQSFVM